MFYTVDKLGLRNSLDAILEALGGTEVGSILVKVSEESVADFYTRYLHDFVRYVYQSANKGDLQEIEFKVCVNNKIRIGCRVIVSYTPSPQFWFGWIVSPCDAEVLPGC